MVWLIITIYVIIGVVIGAIGTGWYLHLQKKQYGSDSDMEWDIGDLDGINITIISLAVVFWPLVFIAGGAFLLFKWVSEQTYRYLKKEKKSKNFV